jgi:hypothetical protein
VEGRQVEGRQVWRRQVQVTYGTARITGNCAANTWIGSENGTNHVLMTAVTQAPTQHRIVALT